MANVFKVASIVETLKTANVHIRSRGHLLLVASTASGRIEQDCESPVP